ncbi:MAG: hypothetical protein HZB56_07045 [Deltaproteobacteria bacterium]|nr:hypothetical protein [Deltaproteobacteria bacterium]
MPRRLALPILATLAACPGADPPFPPYEEPRAPAVRCPSAPVLVNGGTNPAPDPGATCVQAVRDSALPAVSASATHGWIDLGERTVGEVVPFPVPPGTASITVIEQVVDAAARMTIHFASGSTTQTFIEENAAVVAELRDPAGFLVFTDIRLGGPSDGSATPLFFESYAAVTGTLSYPNTSAALEVAASGVAAGDWTVRVGDYGYECALAGSPDPPAALAGFSCDPPGAGVTPFAQGRYRVFVLTRPAAPTGSAIPATGTLDVAFHLVDALAPGQLMPVDAASAPTHAATLRMVDAYAVLLSQAGLCLGTVTFLDAPDWARSRFGTGVSDADGSACGEFSQLLTLSVPGQRTLDLFLVPRIGSGSATLGIDGTIPGPATVNGTVASGAMVSAANLGAGTCPAAGGPVDVLRCGSDEVAYIAAHESGHYLGLYHLTEHDGRHWDPLTGTPSCRTSCSSAEVSPAACARSTTCGGGPNLMFWSFDPLVSRGYLTAEQGQVARTSPLVR